MDYRRPNKNISANLLLKRYADKKSGRVGESRKEIKRRFDYLDWNVQKRILVAFLNSGKTDRSWAYGKLLKFWDSSFEPIIESLWNQFHESKCSWSIIRFFSEKYVLENLDTLSEGDNYYFICKRLGHHPDFCIDKSRLSPLDYLSIHYSTGRNLEKAEALDILYELIGNHCTVGLIKLDLSYPNSIIRDRGFNPIDIRDVRRGIYYLEAMGYRETVEIFIKWCNEVTYKIRNSKEFYELSFMSISDEEFVSRLSNIAVIYMYLSLPLSVMSKFKNEGAV